MEGGNTTGDGWSIGINQDLNNELVPSQSPSSCNQPNNNGQQSLQHRTVEGPTPSSSNNNQSPRTRPTTNISNNAVLSADSSSTNAATTSTIHPAYSPIAISTNTTNLSNTPGATTEPTHPSESHQPAAVGRAPTDTKATGSSTSNPSATTSNLAESPLFAEQQPNTNAESNSPERLAESSAAIHSATATSTVNTDDTINGTTLGQSANMLSSFSYFNVQGLAPQTKPSKVPFISDQLHNNNQLFIGLTETWLYNQLDAELHINNYTLHRTDSNRKKSKHGRFGGGTSIYLRNDIASSSEPILSYSNGSVEIICVHSPTENLLLATIYRQPDDSSHGRPSKNKEFRRAISKLENCISSLENTPDIIIGGDFNIPNAKWPDCTPSIYCPSQESEMINTLSELCTSLHLTQMITEPTHYQGNTLDLVFTNNTSLIHDHCVIPMLRSTSHHYMVTLQTQYKAPNLPRNDDEQPRLSPFDYLNFHSKDANWESLDSALGAVNWMEELIPTMTPDEMLDVIYKITLQHSKNNIPLRKNNTKSKSRQSREIYNLKRRKRRLNKQLVNTTSTSRKKSLFTEQIQVEVKLQKLLKSSARYQEARAIDSIKGNSKYFFSYAKRKGKVKINVGPLKNKTNGKMTSDSTEMSEILADKYYSVCSKPTE